MLFCINVEFIGLKLQSHFSQDVPFSGCGIFPQVICLYLIKYDFLYQWSLQALTIKQKIIMKNDI